MVIELWVPENAALQAVKHLTALVQRLLTHCIAATLLMRAQKAEHRQA
ncbi:MAG: hypothetical protein KDB01_00100 [Planctomycetaceae bacterium]|nr:hypothetical protein [Planctomycetaceae bacterium]